MVEKWGARWWWAKWLIKNLLTLALLLSIYSRVASTPFETIVISLLVLLYIEVVHRFSSIHLVALHARDHRSAIYQELSTHLRAPLASDQMERIANMVKETEKQAKRLMIDSVARSVFFLIVLAELIKTVLL